MQPDLQSFYATGARFFLVNKDLDGLSAYLDLMGWLRPGERLTDTRIAGAGNMNLTLRVLTNESSYVIKQSRPWVEKYPQIPATTERNLVEATYLKTVATDSRLSEAGPELLGHDLVNHILFMEDLGGVGDLTVAYDVDQFFEPAYGRKLLRYLSALHALPPPAFPDNLELRRLNHEHIFEFPYRDKSVTGFDLDTVVPGLEASARPLREDRALLAAAEKYGKIYLGTGNHLLHGDFYPGSWLTQEDRLYVIDAEFAFVGPAEFDLGVYRAHLYFCGASPTLFDQIDTEYALPESFDHALMRRFCGLEIIRRLIGLAQLPLSADLAQRKAWLSIARKMVMAP